MWFSKFLDITTVVFSFIEVAIEKIASRMKEKEAKKMEYSRHISGWIRLLGKKLQSMTGGKTSKAILITLQHFYSVPSVNQVLDK